MAPGARSADRLQLLALTRSRPAWEHLVEQAGWVGVDEPQAHIRSYQPLLDQIALGRRFAFRLKANPVSTSKHPDAPSARQKEQLSTMPRPRGVRVPHRTAAHQLDWFLARAQKWGIQLTDDDAGLPAVQILARDRMSFRKRNATGGYGAPVVLQTATYAGVLRVTDPDRARDALLNGVGPAKAYGLGLLTLAPPASAEGTD